MFLIVTVGLLFWFAVVSLVVDARMHNTIDDCGIKAAFYMVEDSLSGYLLPAGVIAAVIMLKMTLWR